MTLFNGTCIRYSFRHYLLKLANISIVNTQ
jgi:hypothetical protein